MWSLAPCCGPSFLNPFASNPLPICLERFTGTRTCAGPIPGHMPGFLSCLGANHVNPEGRHVHISEGVLSPAISWALARGTDRRRHGPGPAPTRLRPPHDRGHSGRGLFRRLTHSHVPIGPSSAHLILNGLLGAYSSAGPRFRPFWWPSCPAIRALSSTEASLYWVLTPSTWLFPPCSAFCFCVRMLIPPRTRMRTCGGVLLRSPFRGRCRPAHGPLPGLHGRGLPAGRKACSFMAHVPGHDRRGQS